MCRVAGGARGCLARVCRVPVCDWLRSALAVAGGAVHAAPTQHAAVVIGWKR